MLNISGLSKGIVLNHIKVGESLDIYYQLGLNKLGSQTATIKGAHFQKMGRKDIIKVEGDVSNRIDLDVLSYTNYNIVVNIVRDSEIVEKHVLRLPKQITNIIHCKNLCCITPTEQELPHIFYPPDSEREIYHCRHCDKRYIDKTC